MRSAKGIPWEAIPGVPTTVPETIEVLRCSNLECDNHAMDRAKVEEIEAALEPQKTAWLKAEPKAQRLMDLRDLVMKSDLSDDAQFSGVVRCALEVMDMVPGELGNALSVSSPTVKRWASGAAAPHPAMRQPVRRYLLRRTASTLLRLYNIKSEE